MIKILANFGTKTKFYKMTITGHAERINNQLSVPCAVVSAIVLGAVNLIQEKEWKQVNYTISNNQITIQEIAKNDQHTIFFQTIIVQLKTASKYFPKEIRLEVK